MATRKVIRTVKGSHQIDGAGVHLVRVVGYHDVKDFDPFLMLDAFDSKNPGDYIKGFPLHPHRGIETVTYLISGQIEHQDSLGNKGVIHDGECQWMTAGSGIMHQEMPKASERMLGLQLWLNLPQKDKMTPPQYFDIHYNMMATVTEENVVVKVIAGEYKGHKGTKGKFVDATMMDVQVRPDQVFEIPTDIDSNLFVYVIGGNGQFGSETEAVIPFHTVALFDRATDFFVKAGAEGIRFVLFSGKPLNETIAWGGPIVMNTKEELNQAFEELNNGTFIKE